MNKILLLIFAAALIALPAAADESTGPTEDYLAASKFINEYKDPEPGESEYVPAPVPDSSYPESKTELDHNPAVPKRDADSWGMMVSNPNYPNSVSGLSVSSQTVSKKRKSARQAADRKSRNPISGMISSAGNLAHPAPARGGKEPPASRSKNPISSMIASDSAGSSPL